MDNTDLINLIRSHMTTAQLKEAVIYRDLHPIKAGERLNVGCETPVVPFDGFLVFVDLAPRFNWAHPCILILVSNEGLKAELIHASFPPRGRGFPQQFQMIMRFGQVGFESSQQKSD